MFVHASVNALELVTRNNQQLEMINIVAIYHVSEYYTKYEIVLRYEYSCNVTR